MRYRGESMFATVLLVFFGLIAHQSLAMNTRYGTPDDVGTSFFPLVLSVGMLIMTMIVFLKSLFKASVEEEVEGKTKEQTLASILHFVALLGILVIYIALLRPIGFSFATIIFMLAVNVFVFKLKNGRFITWKEFAFRFVGYTVFAFGMAFVFSNVFGLVLP